ncbi:FKBP-type peptidyl-prolyl cis-trans isomerase [Parapedobacter lycopersici]|uniref:FKBP-type peptidyl-prolyl cis-trans isomerase n=1 Tax=Parapedobacter lycopersici TaxID=1864939 RepID=UPI00214DA21F|nr:FKBP-type peptidyl-prolyl cis-trans isomerase [Parapedobacter lycopersici]
MKKVNLLVLGLVVTMGFSSCLKEDSFDESAQFELEKPLLEKYATENFDNPQLNETLGIWYEVLEEGDPDSYEYKIIQNAQNPNEPYVEAPEVLVKYTLKLLDNTVVEEKSAGVEMSLGRTIYAWQYAFLPRQIEGRSLSGLTENGLKKGSRIRIATPSRWAYRNGGSNGIAPNTPLVFDIEVLDIHSPDDDAE